MKLELFNEIIEKVKKDELKKVLLSDEGLSVEQIKLLAEALETNTSLRELLVVDQRLNDESVTYLAIALKKNQTLLKLSLQSTHTSDKAAALLADALLNNNSLRSLDLQNNDLTATGIQGFADVVLHKNQTITYLNLHDNSGAYETVLLVDQVLEKRKQHLLFGFHGLGTKDALRQSQDEISSSETYSSFRKYAMSPM